MRLPTSNRKPAAPRQGLGTVSRAALIRTALGIAALGLPRRPALAAYTIIPTGTIADKEARLREVGQLYTKTPDDPYVFGEKAQLEFDIGALQRNRDFTDRTAAEVRAGRMRLLQRLRLPVDDMDASLRFWQDGMGALVLSSRLVGGVNTTIVGFGPESLEREDGAKFALELIEAPGTEAAAYAGQLQYLQLAMPYNRLSRIMAAGGTIESAYGWTSLLSPGGLPLRVRIDEGRRDPFEFVALRVNNLRASIKHYEGQGMRAGKPTDLRKKISLDINANSFYEASDAMEPDRQPGAVLMSFDDPSLTTGLLLLPPLSRKRVDVGSSDLSLRVVGAAPPEANGAPFASPDGIPALYMGPSEFEASIAQPA